MTIQHPTDYRHAAHAYFVFITLQLLSVFAYNAFTILKKKKLPFVGIVMAVLLDMPAIVCDMYLLKAEGSVNWNMKTDDLILQIIFLVNVYIQLFVDIICAFERKSCCKSVCLIPMNLLFMCLLYAPVTWAMAGWHWFSRISVEHVKGFITDKDSVIVAEALLLIGHIGQWVMGVSIALFLVLLYQGGIIVYKNRAIFKHYGSISGNRVAQS